MDKSPLMSELRKRLRLRKGPLPKSVARMATEGRNIEPTAGRRAWGGPDHRPPQGMRDRAGGMWKGTSRIMDPAARAVRTNPDNAWRKLYRERALAEHRRRLFEALTVPELRAACRKRKVDVEGGTSKATRPALVAALAAKYGA